MIYEQGKAYWEIARRYHANRKVSSFVGPTAVRDMLRLQQQTTSKGVLRSIGRFIAANQQQPPGKMSNDDGPRRA